MVTSNFTEALMGLRRKAQLSGRPLSQAETSGVVAGYADTASERLARSKSLSLQETGLDIERERIASTEKMAAAALDEQRQSRLAQMQAAEDARKQDQLNQLYAGIGTVISFFGGGFFGGGGTWLCTETKIKAGLTRDELDSLRRFRKYAHENHRAWLAFYVQIGPRIVERIQEAHGENVKEFYEKLKKDMILPVIVMTDSCHYEDAYQHYKEYVLKFIDEYAPEYSPEAKIVDRIERIKEAA